MMGHNGAGALFLTPMLDIIMDMSCCANLCRRVAEMLMYHLISAVFRYLRSLMETFNETADKLMDKLSEIAENKTTANMLRLVNCVTMEVIAKVLNF